jgi:hypothetical protein
MASSRTTYLAALTFCLSAASVNAQTISGVVSGIGGPLPDATVCFHTADGSLNHCTTTAPDGIYVSDPLPAGDYVVQASAPGVITEYWNDVPDTDSDPLGTAARIALLSSPVNGISFILAASRIGNIETVAGSTFGDSGPATAASLRNPVGVAVDAAGNVLIADQNNFRIRRVDAVTGVITTVAGSGTFGFSGDGGPATAANFSGPFGVAVDAAGNVLIADQNNARIRP